jgi:hypothetical protein
VSITSWLEVNTREPSLFDTCETPTRWVTSTLTVPARPRLVVMTTTPLAALEPYSAAAAAPLRISTFSMSLGLRSAIRLTGLSCDALPAPEIAPMPEAIALFETRMPSMT